MQTNTHYFCFRCCCVYRAATDLEWTQVWRGTGAASSQWEGRAKQSPLDSNGTWVSPQKCLNEATANNLLLFVESSESIVFLLSFAHVEVTYIYKWMGHGPNKKVKVHVKKKMFLSLPVSFVLLVDIKNWVKRQDKWRTVKEKTHTPHTYSSLPIIQT